MISGTNINGWGRYLINFYYEFNGKGKITNIKYQKTNNFQ